MTLPPTRAIEWSSTDDDDGTHEAFYSIAVRVDGKGDQWLIVSESATGIKMTLPVSSDHLTALADLFTACA